MDLDGLWKKRCTILSIVAFGLLAILVLFCWLLYDGFTAQLAPDSGVWYCSNLGLEISFEFEGTSFLLTPEGELQCLITSHRQSPILNVFIAVKDSNDDSILYHGEQIYSFKIAELNKDYFTAEDAKGHNYIFVRKAASQGSGPPVSSQTGK